MSYRFDSTNLTPLYCGPEPDKAAVNHMVWEMCRDQKLAMETQPSIIDRQFPVTEVLPPNPNTPTTMDKIFADPALTTAVIMGGIFIVAILVIAYAFMSSKSDSGRHL